MNETYKQEPKDSAHGASPSLLHTTHNHVTEQKTSHAHAPPNGGFRAWLVVLGGWSCYLSSYGWLSSIGVFQTYYEQHLLPSYPSSTIAWILSMQVFILNGMAPINGKVFDSYGSNALITIGTFLHVFGIMMISLSSQYYQLFLAQSVCSGIGAAMIFHAATNALSTWFSSRRGLALGLASSGASIGGVVIPIMFERLVDRIGFGWTMRTIAFMLLGLQTTALFTVRSYLDHVPKRVSLLEFLRPFKETPYLCNTIGCFFTMWGILIPFNYIALSGESAGISTGLAVYLIPILNGASLFGRIFPPWIGDHLGRFNTAILSLTFGFVLVLAMWIPSSLSSSPVPTIFFAALYGLPLGCFAAILPALVGQITPDVRSIGVRLGSTFFVTAWAGLTGQPIAGALVQKGAEMGNMEYIYLKVFCGLTIAIGAGFLAAARISDRGWRLLERA
ncbi:MAG: hypothetical protein L6R41_004588 [Letrouitia leprolyta]|nr:MAG: hypothetical protein L6R41_004588 [Letrouitia leprolyta]